MEIIEEFTSVNRNEEVEFRYSYRLIKNTLNDIELYGVEVERRDYIGINNINIERERIDIISNKKNEVEKLVETLYDGQVSPIHMIDVIGNSVDNCAYEFRDDLLN